MSLEIEKPSVPSAPLMAAELKDMDDVDGVNVYPVVMT